MLGFGQFDCYTFFSNFFFQCVQQRLRALQNLKSERKKMINALQINSGEYNKKRKIEDILNSTENK